MDSMLGNFAQVLTLDVSSPFTGLNLSEKYLECLVSAIISHILRLREILPEEFFYDTEWRGCPFKMLNITDENTSEEARSLASWMCAAFEGIEKQYLKSLILEIYEATGKFLLESYTILLDYKIPNSQEDRDISSLEVDIRQATLDGATRDLLEELTEFLTASNLGQLPEAFAISMRLTYNSNVPVDYFPSESSLFEEMECKPKFVQKHLSMKLSTVESQHHFLKLSAQLTEQDKPDDDGLNQNMSV